MNTDVEPWNRKELAWTGAPNESGLVYPTPPEQQGIQDRTPASDPIRDNCGSSEIADQFREGILQDRRRTENLEVKIRDSEGKEAKQIYEVLSVETSPKDQDNTGSPTPIQAPAMDLEITDLEDPDAELCEPEEFREFHHSQHADRQVRTYEFGDSRYHQVNLARPRESDEEIARLRPFEELPAKGRILHWTREYEKNQIYPDLTRDELGTLMQWCDNLPEY